MYAEVMGLTDQVPGRLLTPEPERRNVQGWSVRREGPLGAEGIHFVRPKSGEWRPEEECSPREPTGDRVSLWVQVVVPTSSPAPQPAELALRLLAPSPAEPARPAPATAPPTTAPEGRERRTRRAADVQRRFRVAPLVPPRRVVAGDLVEPAGSRRWRETPLSGEPEEPEVRSGAPQWTPVSAVSTPTPTTYKAHSRVLERHQNLVPDSRREMIVEGTRVSRVPEG